MNSLVSKLVARLGDRELAEILAEAGYGLPSDIRRATNKELKEIEGIGVRQVRAIRAVFPRRV